MDRDNNKNRLCSVPDCKEAHKAKGYCNTHYAQFKRGRAITKEINNRSAPKLPTCIADNCNRTDLRAHNLCSMHYARWLRHDTWTYHSRARPEQKCSIEGCEDFFYCLDMCHRHYQQHNFMHRKYNITYQDYLALKERQNNLCAICKKPELTKSKKYDRIKELAVDHCHETGKVRGLLCGACNSAIGLLKEDLGTLKNAINYLKKAKKSR